MKHQPLALSVGLAWWLFVPSSAWATGLPDTGLGATSQEQELPPSWDWREDDDAASAVGTPFFEQSSPGWFSSIAAWMGMASYSSSSTSFTLATDWLAPLASPKLGSVPTSFTIPLPGEDSVTLHLDNVTGSPYGGVSWHGYDVADPVGRGVITRVGNRYEGSLILANGTFAIQAKYGGVGTVTLVVDEEGLETDSESPAYDTDLETDQDTDTDSIIAPASGGGGFMPFGGRTVIDVLFVYTDAARRKVSPETADTGGSAVIEAQATNNFSVINDALLNSRADVVLRLVGIEQVNMDESTFATTQLALDALQDPSDSVADELHTLADALGADVVLAFADNIGPDFAGGAAGTSLFPNPERDPDTGDSVVPPPVGLQISWIALIDRSSYLSSTRHEFGHLMGLCHAPQNWCWAYRKVEPYAYGYMSSDPTYPFRTIMARDGDGTPCGDLDASDSDSGNNWDCPRQNYFSTPQAFWAPAGSGLSPVSVGRADRYIQGPDNFPGGVTPFSLWSASDASRALEEHAAYIALREREEVPDISVLVEPAIDDAVSGNMTFAWTDVGAVSYVLEVGDAPDDFSIGGYAGSGTSTTINVGSSPGPLAVRLWSEMKPDSWWFNEYRLNNGNQLVSCSAETAGVVPGFQWDGWSCPTTGVIPCDLDSADTDADGPEILCDLDQGGSTMSSRYARMTSLLGGGAALYDYVARGRASDGTTFCCLYADQAGVIDEVTLRGSADDDNLYFSDLFTLTSLDVGPAGSMTAVLKGLAGEDLLVGSTSTDLDYDEELLGHANADVLIGMAGNDLLRAGGGADLLLAGEGNDVLIAGTGVGTDELRGEKGIDFLCTDDASDLLVGSEAFDDAWDVNFLYYSSTISGSPNAFSVANGVLSACGHSSHGSSWGGCTHYTLSAAPAVCSAFVPN
jgi:hypothetical protein